MSILLFQFEITMHNLQNLVKNAYVHVFNKFSFEFNFTWKKSFISKIQQIQKFQVENQCLFNVIFNN